MIKLVFSPQWFYGIDSLFEIFSVIVTLGIAFYALRLNKISINNKYKYFALSFLAIALSLTAKILTNIVIYYSSVVKQVAGPVIIRYNLVQKSMFFFEAGYDAHRFLMLTGLLGIYWIVSKSKNLEHLYILTFLSLIISLFSFNTYYIFHLTAAFLLILILKHYFKLCKKTKNHHTHLTTTSFTLLFLSQIIFVFVWKNLSLYVIAEIIQFSGFLLLLTNFLLLVFTHGKKKIKD